MRTAGFPQDEDFMDDSTQTLVILIDDLIFETMIRGAARASGWHIECAATTARLTKVVSDHSATLNIAPADPIAAIGSLRLLNPPPRILAFVSHVDRDIAERARRAGADEVLPRSRFTNELPQLLA